MDVLPYTADWEVTVDGILLLMTGPGVLSRWDSFSRFLISRGSRGMNVCECAIQKEVIWNGGNETGEGST